MNSKTEPLKQLAAALLNCFGYQYASNEQISIVDYGFYHGSCNYMIVEYENQLTQLGFDNDGKIKSWKLLIRT
mgnify:CR=1 FL=1